MRPVSCSRKQLFPFWKQFNKKEKGRVSALEAKLKSEQEYEQFRVIQDKNFISDFDKEIKRITGKNDDD